MEILTLGVVVSTVVSIVMGLILFYKKELREDKIYVWTFSEVLLITILTAALQISVLIYQGFPVLSDRGITTANICFVIIVLSAIFKFVLDGFYYKE